MKRRSSKVPNLNRTNQRELNPAAQKAEKSTPRRWAVPALCLILAAAGTVAVCELVVWNRLPAELVGMWVVEGGSQDGATFEFSRSGALEAHLDNKGMERIMKATVAVKDRTLYVTTQNPHTLQNETRSCLIRELTARSLIVEFEKGEVFHMARAK
jgi:hypothetical protein